MAIKRKNLFEDMGAEEMRERLQKVSEYADSVIEKARGVAKLHNDDVTEYKAWNTAHGVLEIIHSSGAKEKYVGGLALEIEVDTTELDEAIEKAEHLAELRSENTFDPVEVYGMSKRDLILVLVSNYGWPYLDASNFAERYW